MRTDFNIEKSCFSEKQQKSDASIYRKVYRDWKSASTHMSYLQQNDNIYNTMEIWY